jgi:hypothetical protein
MLINKSLLVTSVVLFGLLIAQTAFAEPRSQRNTARDDGYSYQFTDDNLLGDTIRDVGDMYRGRPKFMRVLLLRPRTSLVQELLKSAEAL